MLNSCCFIKLCICAFIYYFYFHLIPRTFPAFVFFLQTCRVVFFRFDSSNYQLSPLASLHVYNSSDVGCTNEEESCFSSVAYILTHFNHVALQNAMAQYIWYGLWLFEPWATIEHHIKLEPLTTDKTGLDDFFKPILLIFLSLLATVNAHFWELLCWNLAIVKYDWGKKTLATLLEFLSGEVNKNTSNWISSV